MNDEVIFEFLKKTRKRTQAGDVSVFKVINSEYYYYIRTINTDAHSGMGSGGTVLLYFYNAKSKLKEDIPVLDKSNLLIPPIMTNYLGWSRGYFEVIANIPLKDDDAFPVHCFQGFGSKPWYWDEKGNRLPNKIEPCGFHGLASYAFIDNVIRPFFGFEKIKVI